MEGEKNNDIVHVRFPNESYYDEINNFKIEDFIPIQIFEDEAFGLWRNTHVGVMIEDYNRLIRKDEQSI
jgi:hypothetical protein